MQSVVRSGCAIVVGGSRGIGRACSIALAESYTSIAIVFRDNRQAAEAVARDVEARGAKSLVLQADVRDAVGASATIAEIASKTGSINTLVHSAGGSSAWKTVRELSHQEFADIIDLDLNGFFNFANPALRLMHEQRSGTIVAISSIAARACSPRSAQTAAAKAGLEAMIRVIAKEEGKYGIRANAVSIGLTETDMGRDAMKHWGEAVTKKVIAQSALGRIGSADEVANVVAFLASEKASYITGRVLCVDGGQFIGV